MKVCSPKEKGLGDEGQTCKSWDAPLFDKLRMNGNTFGLSLPKPEFLVLTMH